MAHMHQAVLIAAAFGLMAAIGFGVADFLIGKTSKSIGAMKGALTVNFLGALTYGAAYLLFLRHDVSFTAEGVWYALAGGAFFGFAHAAFFKAMSFGPIGLVSSISSTYPLVSLLVGLLFFSAKISLLQVAGIVLVVAGVIVASDIANFKSATKRLGKGPLLALVPALAWGIGLALISQSIARMDWENTFLIELFAVPAVLLLLLPFIKGDEKITLEGVRRGLYMPLIWMAAVIQMLALLSLNLGLNEVPNSAAVVIAISSCYPVLTILLALRHLNERIPLVPLIGGIVGVLGIVILSVG
jgi:drug/metabolite transporter (DMT)-like permease